MGDPSSETAFEEAKKTFWLEPGYPNGFPEETGKRLVLHYDTTSIGWMIEP